MDSDGDSTTPIRWIRPSGGLEKTRVIVDATSHDPSRSLPSEHIQRRETTMRVRAALKIGRAFEELGGRTELEDTGEENIRREDIGLAMGLVASNDKVVDGNAMDLVPPNTAAASPSGSASNVPAASNGSSGSKKRGAAADLSDDNSKKT